MNPKLKQKFANNVDENMRKFVKWDHVKTAFEIDVYGNRRKRHLSKLTEAHVDEAKLKKMSVHHATQVLSQTVGEEIKTLAEHQSISLYQSIVEKFILLFLFSI